MRAGWEKWSNSGNEMIKVWFVASIYIHLAEKIDGKTTRCKSRNQRTLLENCPNTEFSTSSVTKFLFFFQRRGGGDIFDAEETARFEYFIFFSLEKFSGRGMTTSMLPCSFIYISTFLDSSGRITLLFLWIYDRDITINTME